MTTLSISNNALSTTATILELFDRFGDRVYSNGVSVKEHAKQTALKAKARKLDEELTIAAYLHDIGLLLPPGLTPLLPHQTSGANYLTELGFSERITGMVREHVNAKRYLCAMRMYFYQELSSAQQQRLMEQGGPMAAREARLFELNPHFADVLRLRSLEVDTLDGERKWNGSWMASLIQHHLSR